MKWNAAILGLIITLALLAIAEAAIPTLTAYGEGKVAVPADTTIITVSVESSNENATLAQAEAKGKMDEAIEALKAAGVADDEIVPGQSSGITSFQSDSRVCRKVNNSTICENNSMQASSLDRTTRLRLEGTDQSRIDKVLEAARSAGATARVSGYSLSNSSQAVKQARQNAVINARENAEEMANAAGLHLGDALDISDYGTPMAQTEDSENSAEVEVVAYVIVTYRVTS